MNVILSGLLIWLSVIWILGDCLFFVENFMCDLIFGGVCFGKSCLVECLVVESGLVVSYIVIV